MVTDTSALLLSILPEIGLAILIFLTLVLDLAWNRKKNSSLGLVVFVGLLVVMAVSLLFVHFPEKGVLSWGGMLRVDGTSFVFRMLVLAGGAVTVLFAIDDERLGKRGVFYILLLTSMLGMSLMASSADLVMLYLAIETTSIPLYVLAGFFINEPKSVEAGIKYLLFGAMASAIMLFGFSWLFGFSGTTQLYELSTKLAAGAIPLPALLTAMMMVVVGFAFKISAVPLHFWAPDVYEGAPAPVAGFLSTASKAAGFAVLMRFMLVVFPEYSSFWTILIAVIATLSMLVGNYLALAQKNIKRLLAYSSIAQAGYMLIGVAAHNSLGISGSIYYLMAYLVTNLAAFGIVSVVGKTVGTDDLASYAGLSRRSPKLALAMLVAILSLGGIPPFAGFFGKLLVFTSAIQVGMVWLAVVGAINAVIGLYYYLNVLKVIYLYRSEDEEKVLPIHVSGRAALVICIAGVLILGVVMAPWFNTANLAALSLIQF